MISSLIVASIYWKLLISTCSSDAFVLPISANTAITNQLIQRQPSRWEISNSDAFVLPYSRTSKIRHGTNELFSKAASKPTFSTEKANYASYTSTEIVDAQSTAEAEARVNFNNFATNALFVNIDERPEPTPCKISADSPTSALPADLPPGCLLRIGPNGASTDEGFLDGDGLVLCITLPPSSTTGGGDIMYSATYVDTKGRRAERATGGRYGGTLGEAPRGLPMLVNLLRNGLTFGTLVAQKDTCNTALAISGGRILALMEQSPPSEIKISREGWVRTVKCFVSLDGAIPTAPISGGNLGAHGRTDPVTGERVHVSYQANSRPFLRVDVFAKDWKLTSSIEVDVPSPVMVHDLAITENYVVILDFPLTVRPRRFLTDSFPVEYEPRNGARIGLTPRRGTTGTDSETQWFDVDEGVVLHVANAYERKDGTVVIHGFKSIPTGTASFILDYTPPFLHQWILDPSTGETVSERCLNPDVIVEFPQVEDEVIGREASAAYAIVSTGIGGPMKQFKIPVTTINTNSLVKLALEKDADNGFLPGDVISRFDLPIHWHVVSEPTVVTKNGGGGHYILVIVTYVPPVSEDNKGDHVTTVKGGSLKSQLLVLDAKDISSGPVTSVDLPTHVNYGLHSQFVDWEIMEK